MAKGFIPYSDGGGGLWAVQEEALNECVLKDMCASKSIARTAPFGNVYATLADLQAVSGWSAAAAAPNGLKPRVITVSMVENVADGSMGGVVPAALAALTIIVGDEATFDAFFPTGAAPLPETSIGLQFQNAQVTGATGESRTAN